MAINSTPIAAFVAALCKRSPTPGGGAAAALAAALGCAAGAMAARYTTGAKYSDVEAEANALGNILQQAADDCLLSAEADATAYDALTAARKIKDQTAIATATQEAIAVPADLLARCAQHAAGLAGFIATCNPYLVSDVKVGIHLLCGGGRAAWQTLLINKPDESVLAIGRSHLDALQAAEHTALGNDACVS